MADPITPSIPLWVEVFKNAMTAVGIFIGGVWALWRWGYTEWHASRQNRASLDGTLVASSHILSGGNIFVTISCQWNNRGNYPVPIDTMKSVVQVAELPQTLKFGPIEPSEMLQLAEHVIDGAYFEQFPFIEFDGFELEPKTESSLRAHFVLPNERTYLIRWTLVKRSQKRGEGVFCWTKEIVWHPDLEDSSKKA